MPSLLRFLAVIAILCALVYGGLYSLAHFVQPKPREITVIDPARQVLQEPLRAKADGTQGGSGKPRGSAHGPPTRG